MIKCNTLIGFGVPRIENQRVAHGGKLVRGRRQGGPRAPRLAARAFVVPQPIVAEWRKAGVARRRGVRARVGGAVRAARPAERAKFERLMRGELPAGWETAGCWTTSARPWRRPPTQPTVRSSGEITRVLSHAIPELVGGAPDLEAATQHKRDMRPFTADDRGGRYLHYGVREHAMGAMMNGMVAHKGVVPYGATFLVFSDYMRHSIRLSAMMSLPVIWVFSHDSIGIGTQRPDAPAGRVPGVAARDSQSRGDAAVPTRSRPPSAGSSPSPTGARRRRSSTPASRCTTVRTRHVDENLCARGAYVLADAAGGARRATLFAIRVGSRDCAGGARDAAGAGRADGGRLGAVLGAASTGRTRRIGRRSSAAAPRAWRWRPR